MIRDALSRWGPGPSGAPAEERRGQQDNPQQAEGARLGNRCFSGHEAGGQAIARRTTATGALHRTAEWSRRIAVPRSEGPAPARLGADEYVQQQITIRGVVDKRGGKRNLEGNSSCTCAR